MPISDRWPAGEAPKRADDRPGAVLSSVTEGGTWFSAAQVRPGRCTAQGPLRDFTALRFALVSSLGLRPSLAPLRSGPADAGVTNPVHPGPLAKENPVNSVALIGRLTADPQTHAGDKHESATFRLAVPRPGTDGADFVDVVCFDKLAATCAAWLTKGREVAVVGKLRLNEWTSREGERRSRIQVVAATVTFLGKPTTAAEPDGGVAEGDEAKPAVGKYRKAS
jgi:single-strand DNA-binding protein